MKKIPFYPNRKDNNSCMVACLKSSLEYLTGKDYTWAQVDKIIGYKPNVAAWTVTCWTTLAKQGFDIWMIEPFDYALYAQQGPTYLKNFLTPQEIEWQMAHSNLLKIRPLIPEFLKTVSYEKRQPTLKDIDTMLQKGYLVLAQLNSDSLNDKPGYTAHMILIHDKEGNDYIAHDPGLTNASSNRRIGSEKLWQAMGAETTNTEVTGVKLKVKNAD